MHPGPFPRVGFDSPDFKLLNSGRRHRLLLRSALLRLLFSVCRVFPVFAGHSRREKGILFKGHFIGGVAQVRIPGRLESAFESAERRVGERGIIHGVVHGSGARGCGGRGGTVAADGDVAAAAAAAICCGSVSDGLGRRRIRIGEIRRKTDVTTTCHDFFIVIIGCC